MDSDRLTAPLRVHRARIKIINFSLVLRARYSQVFSLNEVTSSNLAVKQRYLIETKQASQHQCKHRTSDSTQFIKQPQDPRLSIRDAARLILRHILAQNQHCTSGMSMAENKTQSRCSTEVIPQRRNICERNISVQQRSTGEHLASIASPPRLNCVRNKVRKTIVRCQSGFLRRVRCVYACAFTFKMVD